MFAKRLIKQPNQIKRVNKSEQLKQFVRFPFLRLSICEVAVREKLKICNALSSEDTFFSKAGKKKIDLIQAKPTPRLLPIRDASFGFSNQ